MSQRRTRANPRPSAAAVPPLAEAPVAPIVPPAVAPVASIVAPTVMKVAPTEDFGRDKNLKTLLKSLQPKAFTGERVDVPKILEEWIMSMDDYFALVEYNALAQGIMGRAKLEGPAKLWWKLHCQSQGKAENSVGWEDLKKCLKERYLPLNFSTDKMNEFLSYVRKGPAIDVYYEDFVKLSRYAPLMTEEQNLSKFILGLEGQLAEEVNALRPNSLADALIRAKAKLSSFQVGDRKRVSPFPPSAPYRLQKVNPYAPQVNHPLPLAAPKMFTQPVKVNALPVFQSGKHIQCFECRQFGHKKEECPNKDTKKNVSRPALPPQKQAFQNRNRNQPRGPAPVQPKVVKANYVSVKEEAEEQAQIYAALDPSGYNRQYSILEAQGDYEGKPLTFLIDSGSSHLFISPNTAKRLRIEAQPTGRKLRASLANGTSILTDEQVIELSFNLEGNSTSQKFRILKMGKF